MSGVHWPRAYAIMGGPAPTVPEPAAPACGSHNYKKPKKKLPPHSGLRAQRKARSTGTLVGLYHSMEAGLESDPSCKWSTVCEDHGGLVGHETRQLAEGWLSHPEDWCPDCQENAKKKGDNS